MTAMTPDKVEAALGAMQPAIDRLHRYAAHELADKLAEARVVLTEALAAAERDAARLDWLEANAASINLTQPVREGVRHWRDPIGSDRTAIDAAMKGTP